MQIFNCEFGRDVVRYIHNGNPHLSTDYIRLTVLHFTRSSTLSHDVILTVHVSPPVGAIFAGTPRPLVVDARRSPTSDVISPERLQFRYNFTTGSVCTVTLSKSDDAGRRFSRQWLMSGQLVTSDGAPVSNVTMDCREFLAAGFRYRVTPARPRTALDFIPLTATVHELSVDGSVATSEAMFVPVRLLAARANSPPSFIHPRRLHLLVADQFTPLLLTSDTLSARDDVTRVEDLLVTVVSPLPGESQGHVVHRRAPWTAVVSFWLGDVLAGSVAWRAVNVTSSSRGVDVLLTVSDGHWELSTDTLRLSIRVRPAQLSAAPRITHNAGLSVMRGGRVCLGTDTLNITRPRGGGGGTVNQVDVRVIRGGPRHGYLSVAGVHHDSGSFEWSKIEQCEVMYQHDVHSCSDSDQLYLRVTTGRRSVRTRVIVRVLPGAVHSLRLSMNEVTEVRQHGYAQITSLHLNSSAISESSRDVIYTITSAPRRGQLLIMYRPMTRGRPVKRFTQLDLDHGHIWYHHLGHSSPLRDSFRFVLSLRTSVVSTGDVEMVHEIMVRPHATDNPPGVVKSSAVRVRETEVRVIGRDVLKYVDGESPSEDVIFVVTCRPYVVGSSVTLDAGHIAYHDDSTFSDKNSSVVPLRTFTQSMIDGEMVAYVPPVTDIGPRPLHVQFIYSVSDLHGNFDVDKTFNITVLPVNNQVGLPYTAVTHLACRHSFIHSPPINYSLYCSTSSARFLIGHLQLRGYSLFCFH